MAVEPEEPEEDDDDEPGADDADADSDEVNSGEAESGEAESGQAESGAAEADEPLRGASPIRSSAAGRANAPADGPPSADTLASRRAFRGRFPP
ncbi:MAG: hypothetical protein WAK71_03475 [Streptosporangiaceae bacterium]